MTSGGRIGKSLLSQDCHVSDSAMAQFVQANGCCIGKDSRVTRGMQYSTLDILQGIIQFQWV